MATKPLYRRDADIPSTRTPRDRIRAIGGGIVAGLVGAVALWIWNGFVNLTQLGVFWPTIKSAAAPFFGERVMEAGFDFWPVLVGIVAHLSISALWGVLFALLFFGISRGLTILAGLFFGLLVWLGMFYIVLPLVGLSPVVQAIPVWNAILMHLWFGLWVGVAFIPFQRTYPRRHEPERVDPLRRRRATV